jgi:hypothetical protein
MPENIGFATDNVEQHDEQDKSNSSHLFLVRLWADSNSEGQIVWCGKVQHVTRGRAGQFRDWPTMIDTLLAMLPNDGRVRHRRVMED